MNKQPVAQHQQWWQHSPLLVLFAGVAICFFVYRGFFYERKPASNSPAYKAAHGLVEGQVNELRVRGVLLQFPPAFFPNPYSADDIIAGQADSVTVDLDLTDWFDPPPLVRSPYLALVPITIARYGVEAPDLGQRQLAQHWKSIADRPELGLREYVETRDNGGWGYRMYVPSITLPRPREAGSLSIAVLVCRERSPDGAECISSTSAAPLLSITSAGS